MNREDALSIGSSVEDDVFSGKDWSALDSSAKNRHSKQKTSASETTDSCISSKQRTPARSITRTHSQLRSLVLKLFSPVMRSSTRKSTTLSQSTGPETHSQLETHVARQESEKKDPTRRDDLESAPRRRGVAPSSTKKPPSSRLLVTEKEKNTGTSRSDLKATQHKSNRRLSNSNIPRPEQTAEREEKSSQKRPKSNTETASKTDRPRASISTKGSVKDLGKTPLKNNTLANNRVALKEEQKTETTATTHLLKQPCRRKMNGATANATTSILRNPTPGKLQCSQRRLTFAKTPSRRTIEAGDLEENSLDLTRRRLVQADPARSERNITHSSPSPAQKVSTSKVDTADNRAMRKGLDQQSSIASKSRRELIQMASQRRFSSSGNGDELPRGPSRRALTKSPIAKDRNSQTSAQQTIQKQPEIYWKPEFTERLWQSRLPVELTEPIVVPGNHVSPPRRSVKGPLKTNVASSAASGNASRNTETSLSSTGHPKSQRDASRRALLKAAGKSVASLKSQRSVTREDVSSRRKGVQQSHGASNRSDMEKKESTRKYSSPGEQKLSRSSSKKNVASRSHRRSSMDKRPRTPRQRSVSPTEPTESSDHDFSQPSVPLFRLTYKNNGFRSERTLAKEIDLDPIILNKMN